MILIWVKCAITLQMLAYFQIALTDARLSPLQKSDITSDQFEWLGEHQRNRSCPNAEAIKPCTCFTDGQSHTSMYCSEIKTEEQLRDVFSNDFPVTDMVNLDIRCKNNNTVERLLEGDLGNVTFKHIVIAGCGLIEVEEAAIAGSYDTLELLSLQDNKLTSVPDLSNFKVLRNLYLVDNELAEFPNITSGSLVDVNLSKNNFTVIPENIIDGMTAVEQLYLYDLAISHIEAGIFTENEKLNSLDLSYNNLTTLPLDAVKLHGDRSDLWLSHNQINNLSTGSFFGVSGILDLRHNLLTELEEEIFKELLEEKVDVMLEDNPFGCDCDIAWLIINETLLERFYVPPICSDGTSFIDLDPAYYEENC